MWRDAASRASAAQGALNSKREHRLHVKVYKAQCTTGTDQRFDYRATVTLGKTVYKGCAQPWK